MNKTTMLSWLLRIVAAIIMLQTLYFKFTAQPEAIYIFTKLGMGPSGRIGTGIVELIASILLLIPRTSWIGALIGIVLMVGALYYHLTILGIAVYNDGGKLFVLALITLVCCAGELLLKRKQLPLVGTLFA